MRAERSLGTDAWKQTGWQRALRCWQRRPAAAVRPPAHLGWRLEPAPMWRQEELRPGLANALARKRLGEWRLARHPVVSQQ